MVKPNASPGKVEPRDLGGTGVPPDFARTPAARMLNYRPAQAALSNPSSIPVTLGGIAATMGGTGFQSVGSGVPPAHPELRTQNSPHCAVRPSQIFENYETTPNWQNRQAVRHGWHRRPADRNKTRQPASAFRVPCSTGSAVRDPNFRVNRRNAHHPKLLIISPQLVDHFCLTKCIIMIRLKQSF